MTAGSDQGCKFPFVRLRLGGDTRGLSQGADRLLNIWVTDFISIQGKSNPMLFSKELLPPRMLVCQG